MNNYGEKGIILTVDMLCTVAEVVYSVPFQTKWWQAQQNFTWIQTNQPQFVEASIPIEWENFCGFSDCWLWHLLQFIIYDAESFIEYVQSAYFCSLAILTILCLTICILKAAKLFECIRSIANLVNTSRLKKNIKCSS